MRLSLIAMEKEGGHAIGGRRGRRRSRLGFLFLHRVSLVVLERGGGGGGGG